MADETDVEDQNADAPDDGKGVFLVQILPAEMTEEFMPQLKEMEDESSLKAEADSCTYQLGPTTLIKPKKIVVIAEKIMENYLHDKVYSCPEMKESAKEISSAVREAVKKLQLDRYRIVCQVTIGEKCNQDVAMSFLCLWKHEFDHYAVATYENEHFFATTLVFVVYKH